MPEFVVVVAVVVVVGLVCSVTVTQAKGGTFMGFE
jgi:hypothetical protein